MRRSEIEHLIRAACDIVGEDELIVIGSQAVLGQFPDAPAEVTLSREADVYPRRNPDAAERIDGAIGEDSSFDSMYGYYAHGVGPATAVLPTGWEGRLVPVRNENTRGCTGWCLEVHDIAASKLYAGREKDRRYVAALLRHGMIQTPELEKRIARMPLPEAEQEQIRQCLTRILHEIPSEPRSPTRGHGGLDL